MTTIIDFLVVFVAAFILLLMDAPLLIIIGFLVVSVAIDILWLIMERLFNLM